MNKNNISIISKGKNLDYKTIMEEMIDFTLKEKQIDNCELWNLTHKPVFSQGRHGLKSHILNRCNIPVVQSDRGGQVTYHGENQAIFYFLFDLNKNNLDIKSFVSLIENCVIELLKKYNIDAHLVNNAPGIYIDNKKVASLGLRVKKHLTYHGLSINVNMDLSPFDYINPCGFENLKMCNITDYNKNILLEQVFKDFNELFISKF